MGIEYGKYSSSSTQSYETATDGIRVGHNLELCRIVHGMMNIKFPV
jgi:hypothetical protein